MPRSATPQAAAGRFRGSVPRRREDTAGEADATLLHDEVGTIVAQWQRERPDLDPAPMALFGHLARVHLLTTPYLEAVVAGHGLTRGTFDVLSALRRAGPPFSLTPRRLAASLMLSGAGMSHRLDRLEAALLVARLPDPGDRRSVLIQLTQRGVALIDALIPAIIEAQWHVVSALGHAEGATLVDLLQRLGQILSRSATPPPSGTSCELTDAPVAS